MAYPTNITDDEWTLLEGILDKKKKLTGFCKQKYKKRDLINAMLYVNKTGCQWRYIPNDFPPWAAVYKDYRRLGKKQIFKAINDCLSIMVRVKEGRNIAPSLLCIDSQSVKGDVNLDEKGYDGNKRINGRKFHIVVDVLGMIKHCSVTAANIADITVAREMLTKISLCNIKMILIDQGYKGLASSFSNHDIEFEMASKPPSKKGFVPVKIRWVVERTFAWLSRQRRIARNYEVRVSNQESMIYIGMMKIMLRRITA